MANKEDRFCSQHRCGNECTSDSPPLSGQAAVSFAASFAPSSALFFSPSSVPSFAPSPFSHVLFCSAICAAPLNVAGPFLVPILPLNTFLFP